MRPRPRLRPHLNPILIDTTLASNNNLRSGTFYSEQQCWNGNLTQGPSRSGLVFSSSRTTACSAAQGGTAAGRVWIFHP
jgi:hypothetical protein